LILHDGPHLIIMRDVQRKQDSHNSIESTC